MSDAYIEQHDGAYIVAGSRVSLDSIVYAFIRPVGGSNRAGLSVLNLEQVYGATQSDGVAFLGVDIRDQKDQALAFVKGRKVTYPSLFDPPGKVALAFRSVPPSTIPATMILDRKGRVAAVIRRSVLASELRPMVTKVAAEKS